MGVECLEAVNKALAGVDICGPWGKDGEMLHFNVNVYALFSAIAFRQPDTGWGGDPEPICIYHKQDLLAATHMSADSIERARRFLIKAGILSYWKSVRHKDIDGTNLIKDYRDVYRIDPQAVARYTPGWRLENCKWKSANSGSAAADSGESDLKTANSGSYDITKRNNRKNRSSSVSLKDLSPERQEMVRAFGDEVAAACGVERSVVNDEILYSATKGRAYASLHEKIKECTAWLIPGCKCKDPAGRVAILVKQLKMVPTSDKDPRIQKEKAAFEPPTPLPADSATDITPCAMKNNPTH